MDKGLFMDCINAFRNTLMTEKGGNKLYGDYDISIKKWQKGVSFAFLWGSLVGYVHNYILFSSVCMRRYRPNNLL